LPCIPPNPRRVGYIDPIHGPLDGPLYMGSHIHQHLFMLLLLGLKNLVADHNSCLCVQFATGDKILGLSRGCVVCVWVYV